MNVKHRKRCGNSAVTAHLVEFVTDSSKPTRLANHQITDR